MDIFAKAYRFFNFGRIVKYKEDIKQNHNLGPDLFSLALRDKVATELQVAKLENGLNVSLKYAHDQDSRIEYHFKYNRDGLLLLRGASINNKMIIASNSIPDFAISARPWGQSCKAEWVPAHGKVNDVSLNVDMKIDYTDKYFELHQKFEAVNPRSANQVMWVHLVSHKISLEAPFLEISNQINFVADTEIKKLYLTMLPIQSRNINKLYLSNGMLITQIPNDGSSIEIAETIPSAMYVKENKNTLDYLSAVEGVNPTIAPAVLTFRKDNISKFYVREMNDEVAKKGKEITRIQRIVCLTSERL